MRNTFRKNILLTLAGLVVVGLTCSSSYAQGRIRFFHFGRYDTPPRVYGYKLDEDVAGHYGGIRYREYYSYGRGFGPANYPGRLPNYPGNYLPYRYWPYPSHEGPKVAEMKPYCAYITVVVPEKAQVWLEGQPMKQQGTHRKFQSPPLKAGQQYAYQVKVKWEENGKQREQIRDVMVRPGNAVNVSFPNTEATTTTEPTPVVAPLLSSPPIVVH